MTDPGPRTDTRIIAAAALVLGPALALLDETGVLSIGPSGTLWPIGFVTAAGAAGVVAGFLLAVRISRLVGALVAVPNALVLALYGFLLLFFGFGGSR